MKIKINVLHTFSFHVYRFLRILRQNRIFSIVFINDENESKDENLHFQRPL